MKRELWLRFNGAQEYLEKEQKILSILEEFKVIKGDCVLIYNSNTRAVKTLKVNVEITEELLQRLTEFLDSESVKVAEKEDYDKAIEIINEGILENEDEGFLYYNRACFYVGINKLELALEDVFKSIELNDFFEEYMKKDEELDAIRGLEKYKEIFE